MFKTDIERDPPPNRSALAEYVAREIKRLWYGDAGDNKGYNAILIEHGLKIPRGAFILTFYPMLAATIIVIVRGLRNL